VSRRRPTAGELRRIVADLTGALSALQRGVTDGPSTYEAVTGDGPCDLHYALGHVRAQIQGVVDLLGTDAERAKLAALETRNELNHAIGRRTTWLDLARRTGTTSLRARCVQAARQHNRNVVRLRVAVRGEMHP